MFEAVLGRVALKKILTKEKTVNNKDTIQFTIDLKAFIRCVMNDPTCREEIAAAWKEGPGEPTATLGAANLGGAGEQDEWFSLFIGTNRQVEAGTRGFVYRNRKGTRISARLKKQPDKNQEAQTLGETLPEHMKRSVAAVLKEALSNPEVAKALVSISEQSLEECYDIE